MFEQAHLVSMLLTEAALCVCTIMKLRDKTRQTPGDQRRGR